MTDLPQFNDDALKLRRFKEEAKAILANLDIHIRAPNMTIDMKFFNLGVHLANLTRKIDEL